MTVAIDRPFSIQSTAQFLILPALASLGFFLHTYIASVVWKCVLLPFIVFYSCI